jgi:hypothetical protein
MLDMDRFHAYSQSWALQKHKVNKAAAEAILALKPSEIAQFRFSAEKMADAFNYDEMILTILSQKHPEIKISKSDVAWGYDFYKRKLNASFLVGKPSGVSDPVKTSVLIPGESGGIAVGLEAAEAEDVLLNVDSYVANRTTRGVFWEASQSSRKIELHVGSAGDFKQNLSQRGAKIIGEVKTEANNYNPIYLIQDPGEQSFHYAVTEISGNDRLKHFKMQSSLVRWEKEKGRLAPPPPIEVVGDAAAKLASEEAQLTQVLKVVPKADHVLIGQKGAFERTIGSLGKIQSMIELAEKHPEVLSDILSGDHLKLLEKAIKNKSDLTSFVMKNASAIDKAYEKMKPSFARYNIAEAPVHTVYNLDRGSYAVSDYLLQGTDGKVQRWRVFSNVWGDEILPVAKALKATGHHDIVYMGTAGALPNSGLKVGDLAIPTKSHDINGVTRQVKGRIAPVGAKKVDVVTHVSSPFEETKGWLDDRNKFAQLVEVETGYIAQVFSGKDDKVSMLLLVSDAVGVEGESLAEASSSVRRKAQITAMSTVLDDARVGRPVTASLSHDDILKWMDELAPSRDPVSRFQIYKEAEFRKIASKEDLSRLLTTEKGFTTQRLLTSIEEADTRLGRLLDLVADQGLRPVISIHRQFLEGRWNPGKAPISFHLQSADPETLKAVQEILEKMKLEDKNFAKFLQVSASESSAGLDFIKLPGFLDSPSGTLFNLYQDSAIGFGGLALTETRTGNFKFVQVAPPTKGQAVQTVAYFAPNEETEVLLKEFTQKSSTIEKSLKERIKSINKWGENKNWEIRLNKVESLADGALASITPELGADKLIINVNMTPQGLSNKAVALEEYIHLLQITQGSDDYWTLGTSIASFGHPYEWAETVANAKAGSPRAMEQLARMELEAIRGTESAFDFAQDTFGLNKDQMKNYLKSREAQAEKMYKDIAKLAKVDMKKREAAWDDMKEVFTKMENEPVKFNDLVAKNDRKGVRKMLEKYLPWDMMEPSEVNAWKEWLEAIEHPNLDNTKIVFRGLDGDILIKSPSGNPGLMSTVLTKNQGSYTRRLRSLSTSRDKFGVFKNGSSPVTSVRAAGNNPSLIRMMKNHADEPKGSPFLSASNNSVSSTFGMEKRAALRIDERRLVPNAMAWSFLQEREVLVPLVVFPDEVVHFEEVPKGTDGYIYDQDFIKHVEQKLGRPLTTAEVVTNDTDQDFIKQGYERIKKLMLEPANLPAMQACTLEGQSCDCVFKTLNSLLK